MRIEQGATVWIMDGFNGPQRATCTGNVMFTRAQDGSRDGIWIDDGPDHGFRRLAGPERYDVWIEVVPASAPAGLHLTGDNMYRRFEPISNLTRHKPKRRGTYGTSALVTDPADWRL